jgi:hypothetical protein
VRALLAACVEQIVEPDASAAALRRRPRLRRAELNQHALRHLHTG